MLIQRISERSISATAIRYFLCIVASIILSCGTANATDRFHFWIKAFIPNKHPNLENYFTRTLSGTWVLRAPTTPKLGQIGKLSDTCFLTDNRGFSNDPTASARVTSEFVLVIKRRNVSIEKAHGREMSRVGLTQNVDCKSGKQLQSPLSSSSDTVSVGTVKEGNFLRVINTRASSPNPYYNYFGFSVAPRIDYEVVIRYSILMRTIEITIIGGIFPAFEAYYRLNNGRVHQILKWMPQNDATAVDLFDFGLGLNSRRMIQTIKVP